MLTRRSTAVVATFSCVLLFASCHGFFGARDDGGGGGGGTGVTPSFAVVANAMSTSLPALPNIASYTVNASNGVLTLTAGSPTALTMDSLGVAANSAGTHIFLAAGSQGILNFPIDRGNGVLQNPAGTGVVDLFTPSALVSNSAGSFVYAISNQFNSLMVFQVASDGSMTPSDVRRTFDLPPLNLALDPSGRFLYVVDNTDGTFVYSVNSSTGVLTGPTRIAANGGLAARGIAFTPDSKFAYISNGASTGGVDMYAINASNGNLTLISGSPAATGASGPGAIAVDPTGKYVYVANSGSGSVSAFTIGTDGALTPVSGSPFTAAANPVAVVADPSGLFVYVAAKDAQKVLIYKIGSSGGLTSVGSVDSINPVSIVVTK